MILSEEPRHISSSSEPLTRFGRRSSSLSASQIISRIVLSNLGFSSESSIIPYLPSSRNTPLNSTSTSMEALCSICLEPLDEEKGELYSVNRCSHTFHKHCIAEWKKFSTKCPCCRGPLPDDLGRTFSRIQNMPNEEVVPAMTTEGIWENIIFGPILVIWPVCVVSLFVLFESGCLCIFIFLTFFMGVYVIFQEESHNMVSVICFVIILCIVFPLVVVILVAFFILQIFYVLYRTVVFYANVFTCKMRWSGTSKFIINRTINLITYFFEVLEEL